LSPRGVINSVVALKISEKIFNESILLNHKSLAALFFRYKTRTTFNSFRLGHLSAITTFRFTPGFLFCGSRNNGRNCIHKNVPRSVSINLFFFLKYHEWCRFEQNKLPRYRLKGWRILLGFDFFAAISTSHAFGA
jgi:hypothetical protein